MLKQIIKFLMLISLTLISTLSLPATVGQWNIFSGATAIRASMLYEAMKGTVQASVLITPSSADVSKILKGGLGGVALGIAVEELLGAVDWVMDPENNQIKYKPKPPHIAVPILYANAQFYYFENFISACKYYQNFLPKEYNYRVEVHGNYQCFNFYYKNGSEQYYFMVLGLGVPPLEEKTLPLETIAQKIIENAENDDVDAQFAILAATNAILVEAEQDDAKAKPIEDELERNATCRSENNLSKPAICDVEPKDLCEQLVLAEAKAGAGYRIMADKQMGDEPRLIAHYGLGEWIKKEHVKICSYGIEKREKVVHYFHSLSSYKNVELKFKKR